ncbi:MAG: 2-amino-4-hydroxy-6-hydroxymethyldihydropteridine diphosphokinase [Marinagarivorans sp.]|nr:2-amino-4-hydroxy-6-hydroxymethyldihydropteridine diphosphokinase [Marinagarivorans sp.]
MAQVLLGLGSNKNPREHIRSALNALTLHFGSLVQSPIYESESVGFQGSHFLNMVVEITTSLPVGELLRRLRQIEDSHGRDRSQPKFASRTLDIDILTYDQMVGTVDGVSLPRDEILKNAFVLKPLADNWPNTLHPEVNRSFLELWQNYDQRSQKLWPVTL